MPLDASRLGAALKSAATGGDPGDTAARWNAIAAAIVAEVKMAQVAAGIPVSTTGSPSAQTGSTTAPGTIS